MRTNHLVTIETKAPRLAMCSGPETGGAVWKES
jgi:hypothetical protein